MHRNKLFVSLYLPLSLWGVTARFHVMLWRQTHRWGHLAELWWSDDRVAANPICLLCSWYVANLNWDVSMRYMKYTPNSKPSKECKRPDLACWAVITECNTLGVASKSQKIISHNSGAWKIQDKALIKCLVRTCILFIDRLSSWPVLTWQRGWEVYGVFL